jgi:hypothetical protein
MGGVSPYILDDARLADVIAAIQTLGIYPFYKSDISKWAERISGNAKDADHWRRVFEEHPEFFRLSPTDEDCVSLVLRRQRRKRYHTKREELLPFEEFRNLPETEKKKVSREPLNAEQIAALINVAIGMHDRALERQNARRWLVAPLLAFAGGLLGAGIPILADLGGEDRASVPVNHAESSVAEDS